MLGAATRGAEGELGEVERARCIGRAFPCQHVNGAERFAHRLSVDVRLHDVAAHAVRRGDAHAEAAHLAAPNETLIASGRQRGGAVLYSQSIEPFSFPSV